ncbi:MAG TPA: class F sortase, partial [Jatrophihabitans sp.]|nr:class F sortase [Jatrophihabitans sp.]
PARLTIPAIGVRSGLQPLGLLKDGSLQSPTKWGEAGWYAKGIVPGQVGPAVIAGHVDSTSGPAVFYRLRQLRPGAQVVITQRDGRSLTFVVDQISVYRKSSFPTAAVYGPTPNPQLRLVTCTGDFDAAKRSYVDNLVVSAHLAG